MPDKADEKFPGYDVLDKRRGPSWNEQTRRVIDERLAVSREPVVFTEDEFRIVDALAARIVPQGTGRPPIPVAALIDDKLSKGRQDGFRHDGMPREREAWRQGLAALDAEARDRRGRGFVALAGAEQDALIGSMQKGELRGDAWGTMPSALFFKQRCAHDIVFAYYSHPTSWNEIGWGGPASPRGYVRMGSDERDPWEAAEVKDGDTAAALRKNRRVG